MSPYEIVYPGASVEHFNAEPGQLWIQRLLNAFPNFVWLNPLSKLDLPMSQSVVLIQSIINKRMYPITLDGLDEAMRELSK